MSKRSKAARVQGGGRRAQRRAVQADRTGEVEFLCWLVRAGWRPRASR
jgi:hypothetical protein